MLPLEADPAPELGVLADLTPAEAMMRARSLAARLLRRAHPTIVHVGDAESVVAKHFMARLDPLPPMRQVNDGVWAVTLRLPERSRVEYKIAVTHADGEELLPDTLNPRTAYDPFGFNSVVTGPGYAVPEWVDAGAPHGRFVPSRVRSPGFHAIRRIATYLPFDYPSDAPYPLLMVHDGRDFRLFAALAEALDGLIARRQVPPLVATLIDPVDRFAEYGDDPRHAVHVEAVIRHVSRRYRIDHDPARWTLMGASLGAVASLSAARRIDVAFGGLVLLSGSFVSERDETIGRGPQFDRIIEFSKGVMSEPGRLPTRIAMACGAYENLVVDNRRMAGVLGARTELRYEEAPDGHHWHNWRDRLGPALTHVMGVGERARPGLA